MTTAPIEGNMPSVRMRPSSSNLKTYGFALAILVGIGGLVIAGVGYFQVGALSNLSQINATILMAAGGGAGALSLLSGAIGSILEKSSRRIPFPDEGDLEESIHDEDDEEDYLEAGMFDILEEDWAKQWPCDRFFQQISALQILSHLSADELGRCALVCKFWSALVSHPHLLNSLDLRTVFPKLRIVDQQAWKDHVDLEQYNLSFNKPAQIDRALIISELRNFSSLPTKGDTGFSLLTIPAGLSFNKLEKIAMDSDKVSFRHLGRFSQSYRGAVTLQSYTVLISHSVLKGSCNKSVNAQNTLVQKYGCEIPGVLDVATLLYLTYMMTEERLYPQTTTRCMAQVCSYQLKVGNFDFNGIDIPDLDGYCGGVAGFRKLP